mgnify:CR=1 FL=1
MSSGGREGGISARHHKKAHHEEAHGGSWKVAYADFVTAMMALFMVLWIMSQEPEVRENIATYFNNPGGIPTVDSLAVGNKGAGVLDNANGASPMDGSRGVLPAMERITAKQEKENMQSAAQSIKQKIAADPELQEIAEFVQVQTTTDGIRVELIDKVKGTFFALGSAAPSEKLKRAVKGILDGLATLDNQITIEGHTDSRPFAGGQDGYSNWELSADRANTVRRLILNEGFPADRIDDIRAFADRMPLPGSDPSDERNRRISVMVKARYPQNEDGGIDKSRVPEPISPLNSLPIEPKVEASPKPLP